MGEKGDKDVMQLLKMNVAFALYGYCSCWLVN